MTRAPSRPRIRAATAAVAVTASAIAAVALLPSADADDARDKIEQSVLDDLRDGSATFFLSLSDRADVRAASQSDDPGTVTYEAMTAFADDYQSGLRDILDRHDADYEAFWITNTIKVTGDAELVDELAARGEVVQIRPERSLTLSEPVETVSVDAEDGVQWGVEAVKADQVWAEFGVDGDGVVIGSIDSGVQYDHPALVASYRGNDGDGFTHDYNWFDPSGICPEDAPCDNQGHGTHTVGTMVGADGYGVAPGARWMAAKGCEARSCSEEALLASGQWMLAPTDLDGDNPRPDLAPDIINNSWGGGRGEDWYGEIIDAWRSAGIFAPFAAGNGANGQCGTVDSPGDNAGTYTVGAVDSTGTVAAFSGRGPAMTEGKPDITAPGVDVVSTVPGGQYAQMSGTSMATPHISGIVALLWSASPALYRQVDATAEALNSTAVDTEDTTCGGDAEFNHVYGNGIADALAAVAAAPRGDVGLVTGTVTDAATGEPVRSAAITVVGEHGRTTTSDADGRFRVRVSVGEYEITAAGYGYRSVSESVTVSTDEESTVDFSLIATPRHDVTGVVTDPYGRPVAGSAVTIDGAPIDSVVTATDGSFRFDEVAEGEYDVTVTPADPARCLGPTTDRLHVDGLVVNEIAIDWRVDPFGWYCSDTEYRWEKVRDEVAIAGDEDAAVVELPFPVDFYGAEYPAVTVNTNGRIGFTDDKLGLRENTALPTATNPNGFLAAFWDDLVIDERASVRSGLVGRGADERFVIEFDDAALASNTKARISFQVVFAEDGGIVVQYRNLRGDAEAGESATVGVESPQGSVATMYSYNAPVLFDGLAIRFDGPEPGEVDTTEVELSTFDPEATDSASSSLDESWRSSSEESDTPPEAGPGELVFAERSVVDSDNGLASVLNLGGTSDRLQVNEFGVFARIEEDGDRVWRRGPAEFYGEWPVTPARPWDSGQPAFRVPVGLSGVGLTGGDLDGATALGDLTGDGVDDLAFISIVGAGPGWAIKVPGHQLSYGTFVTVLDGETGETVWHRFFAFAVSVVISDGTLVVADQPVSHRQATDAYQATVTAYAFEPVDGAVTVTETWTIDGGSRTGAWPAMELVSDGIVALSSEDVAIAGSAQLRLIDAATGEVSWNADVVDAPRSIAYDEARRVLVGTEQTPFSENSAYTLATYALDDGARTVVSRRVNALPVNLTIADVTKARGAEYLVAEAILDQYGWADVTQLRAVDGQGRQQWPSYSVKRSPDNGHDGSLMLGVTVVDGTILVNRADDSTRGLPGYNELAWSAGLTAIDGRDGDRRWETTGTTASPTYSFVEDGRTPVVTTIAADQTVYSYRVSDGRLVEKGANLGVVTAMLSADVNGDAVQDLIVGGSSHGLFALDGSDLDSTPTILWQAELPGSVRELEFADDGASIVVAASTAAVVVDTLSGRVTSVIDGHDELVWSVTVGDVDGRSGDEIIVPTDAVRAYSVKGKRLWSHDPGDGAIFASASISNGVVYASYGPRFGTEADLGATAVALSGDRGRVQWTTTSERYATPQLWGGVAAEATMPGVDGPAVAFAWTTVDQNGVTEFLDPDTGESLGSFQTTGRAGHRGFSTIEGEFAQLTSYQTHQFRVDGHTPTAMTGDPWDAAVATGPSGERLVVMANAGYLAMWNASMLGAGVNYPRSIEDTTWGISTQDLIVVDLTGDGVDEVIGFTGDPLGYDMVLGLTGYGQWQASSDRTGIVVYNVTTP
ncbi:S8 family serine peptidase [Stackebrandtia soli]|uniref:S8 family serine peptidase n=1 Tax=Stackebrandtia soli TaxID=1892856 RepID=UPI0039E89728